MRRQCPSAVTDLAPCRAMHPVEFPIGPLPLAYLLAASIPSHTVHKTVKCGYLTSSEELTVELTGALVWLGLDNVLQRLISG